MPDLPTKPEAKSATESVILLQKADDVQSGRKRPDSNYPYLQLDYDLPFTHIGTDRQLFVDNFMLDHLESVERVFPTPEKLDHPIIEIGDLPWETHANPIPSGAIHDPDDGKFKIWYCQSLSGDPFNTGQVLCYAESDDCVVWRKPRLTGSLPYGDDRETNIVHRDTAAVTIVLNHDTSDASRKYLMLYCPYGEARERGERILSRVAASADGLKWNVISDDSPFRHQHELRVIYDSAIQQWIGYAQHSHHWHNGSRVRQIGRQTSPDFIHWSPKTVVLSPDTQPHLPPDIEFGSMRVHKVGGLYLGMVSEYVCDPLWCVNKTSGANWRDQARPRLGLYCSRDGLSWQCVRSGWVENGPPGSPDYGYLESPNGPFHHSGKTYVPYLACPHKQWATGRSDQPSLVPEFQRDASELRLKQSQQHGIDPYGTQLRRSIGMLVFPEDAWAILRPVCEEGHVITRQFVFEGDTLYVNAECNYGFVRVEVLDPWFKPYPGFAAMDCDPIHQQDSETWQQVSWKGQSDVSPLWNKPVRLRIHLHEATISGFEFRWRKPRP